MTGDIVDVVEVKEIQKMNRIRGKLKSGLWISLKDTEKDTYWVNPSVTIFPSIASVPFIPLVRFDFFFYLLHPFSSFYLQLY